MQVLRQYFVYEFNYLYIIRYSGLEVDMNSAIILIKPKFLTPDEKAIVLRVIFIACIVIWDCKTSHTKHLENLS